MASDLDFSPPEVPEPTFLENLLRYGLFLGAIFQLICVLAIIVPIPKACETHLADCFLVVSLPMLLCSEISSSLGVRSRGLIQFRSGYWTRRTRGWCGVSPVACHLQ
ncbi:protein MANBAL isoform X3 [Tenrec ecaudatus]